MYQAYLHCQMFREGNNFWRSWNPTSHHHRRHLASLQVRKWLKKGKVPRSQHHRDGNRSDELCEGDNRMMRLNMGKCSLGTGQRGKKKPNGGKEEGVDGNNLIFFFSEPFILASELKSCL